MAKDISLKKEADRLMRLKGEVRGSVFLATKEYISKTKGKLGLRRVEKEMRRLGYSFNFEKVQAMKWYPIGLRAINFIVVKRVFNWGDQELAKMGYASPVLSRLIKMLIRFFITSKKMFQEVAKLWGRFYDFSRFEVVEYNEEEKYVIIRIYDFNIHPNFCVFYRGYFRRILEFTGAKNVSLKETKCMYKGDPYHEYVARWE